MLHISISKADTIRYRHHYNSLWMIFSQLFSYFHQNMLKSFSILKVIETAADKNLSSNLKTIKFRVSQQHIGPLILEKSQMYILTRVNLLYTLCYEIPCNRICSTYIPSNAFVQISQSLMDLQRSFLRSFK